MTPDTGSVKENQFLKTSIVPGPIYHVCRILLGLVFIIASIDKIASPWEFGRAILAYDIMVGPLTWLISPMAVIMPVLELVTGVLLIFHKWVRPSAILLLAMNIMFTLAVGAAIFRGMEIDCGCGLDYWLFELVSGTTTAWGAMVRDLVFLMMNLVVLFAPQSKGK